MAFHPIKPEGSTTGRGPSRTLWNASRYGEICMDPNAGYIFLPFDDFCGLPDGKYGWQVVTATSSGTGDLIAETNGVVSLASGSNDGAGIALASGGQDELGATGETARFANVTAEANTKIVFEASIRIGTAWTTGSPVLIGLGEATDIAKDAGMVSSDDVIGFHNYSGSALSATALYAVAADSTTLHQATTANTVSATSAFTKVGFIVEGTSKVRYFVDGVEITADESAVVPSTIVGPVASILTGGATSPSIEMDWWYGVKSFRKN